MTMSCDVAGGVGVAGVAGVSGESIPITHRNLGTSSDEDI